jgi:hypothetical protein
LILFENLALERTATHDVKNPVFLRFRGSGPVHAPAQIRTKVKTLLAPKLTPKSWLDAFGNQSSRSVIEMRREMGIESALKRKCKHLQSTAGNESTWKAVVIYVNGSQMDRRHWICSGFVPPSEQVL